MDLGDLEQHIQGMYKHFDDQIGFSRPPTLFLDSDPSNAPNTLGKTAYYDPQTFEIHVYTDGRHPKDMLRSIAHELIHHQQNLEGRLDVGGYHGEGYYLHNEALKELEQEAMLEGNHYLREYEDTLKTQENQMSLREWKNKELFENLMEKWGIKTNILNEKKLSQDELAALEPPKDKVTRADVISASGGEELEEANVTYSVDPDFMKKYVNLKYGEKERTAEKIEDLYTQSLTSSGRDTPTDADLEKMGIKCPECEGKGEECKCPKKEEIEEGIMDTLRGIGGTIKRDVSNIAQGFKGALEQDFNKDYWGTTDLKKIGFPGPGGHQYKSSPIMGYVRYLADQGNSEPEEALEAAQKRFKANRGAPERQKPFVKKIIDIVNRLREDEGFIAFKDDETLSKKYMNAAFSRASDRLSRGLEETSSGGAVSGAISREDLKESINSILKENKKLIKRLLK